MADIEKIQAQRKRIGLLISLGETLFLIPSTAVIPTRAPLIVACLAGNTLTAPATLRQAMEHNMSEVLIILDGLDEADEEPHQQAEHGGAAAERSNPRRAKQATTREDAHVIW